MWIGRRPDGTVYGIWFSEQPHDEDHPGLEEVADNHPDILNFRAAREKRAQEKLKKR